jgi:hypothetical protein
MYIILEVKFKKYIFNNLNDTSIMVNGMGRSTLVVSRPRTATKAIQIRMAPVGHRAGIIINLIKYF